MRSLLVVVLVALLAACGPGVKGGPTINNKMSGPALASETVESTEILEREPRSNHTKVKHILIGWADKAGAYSGGMDPRAEKRSRSDAERVVRDILAQLANGADFEAVMAANSEDKGSATSDEPYDVSPDAGLVIEFRQLGLRLDVGEVGVVESDYGFHIMKRFE